MTTSGNANWGMQARQAGGQGTGGPSMKPGGGDKRAVLIILAGLAAFGITLAFLAS